MHPEQELDEERAALIKLCNAIATSISELRDRVSNGEAAIQLIATTLKQDSQNHYANSNRLWGELGAFSDRLELLEESAQPKPTFKSPTDDIDAQVSRVFRAHEA